MTPYVLDTETNVRNYDVGKMKASPYHPDNNIVAMGYTTPKGYVHAYNRTGLSVPTLTSTHWWQRALVEPIILVGQNIGFDLLHIMKLAGEYWKDVSKNIYIWDTQQVAYLLSGQTHMYPSLDELSEQYGLELKDDEIKKYWEDGVDTSDIPKAKLLTYMEADVLKTQHIFRKQWEEVKTDPRLFALIKVKMEDLLATIMMEHSGMQFDISAAHVVSHALQSKVEYAESEILNQVKGMFEPDFEYNPRSLDHLSLALFGGPYTMDRDQPVVNPDGSLVVYKTGSRKGQVKTKRVSIEYSTKGKGLSPIEEPNKKGIYSTRDEVLEKLGVPLTTWTLILRTLEKELNTYYIGYSKLVWPDGKIHPSINHCSTRTGRQSCTQPNLQNVTSKEE